MAIDYGEEWKKLHNRYGGKEIYTAKGKVKLYELMNGQIHETICRREKLMGEFIKERIITTNITDGTKDSHLVDIIFRKNLFGRVSIGKEEFQKWIENRKGGRNEK